MKKGTFTEEQIAYALRQAETGTPVADICRKLGVSEQTFYRWKKKFAGMGIAELRRLRQLEVVLHYGTCTHQRVRRATRGPSPPAFRSIVQQRQAGRTL